MAGEVTTFRVFSGWDRRQAEAAEVFAYSVCQNASIDVDIRVLQFLRRDEGVGPACVAASEDGTCKTLGVPGFKRTGRTEFSYTRFLVPHLCGYEGRAAFFDGCDMLCLGDVAELAEFDMQGAAVCVVKHQAEPRLMRGGRARSWSSVMLMDCAKLTWWTPEYVERAPDGELMRLESVTDDGLGELPSGWNALLFDGDKIGGRGSVHGDKWTVGLDETVVWTTPAGLTIKLAHWSYISDPDAGPWIDASGSELWKSWRERWRGDR